MRARGLVSTILLAACYHGSTNVALPPSDVGAYRFRAEMWRDPSVRGARNNTDSLGVFEGVLNLRDDLKESTIDLDTPETGPGCANRGVQLRADLFRNAGEMLMFSCPGLGPENRAVAALFFNIADPMGNSHWLVTFRQEDCAPQPGTNELDPRCIRPLSGVLRLARTQ